MSSSYYEIRIVGVLPPEALIDFERLSAEVEPVETVLHGPLQDQAALHGLLDRLQTFGVKVMEVRRLHSEGPAQQDPTQQDPTQQDPTQQDPTQQDPTQQDPDQQDPTQQDPTQQDPDQ